jgi:hypothetical protein
MISKRENAICYIIRVMNALLNKSHVKKYTLHVAATLRPAANFSRVSEEFLLRVEKQVRVYINGEIHRHPTNGVTIK